MMRVGLPLDTLGTGLGSTATELLSETSPLRLGLRTRLSPTRTPGTGPLLQRGFKAAAPWKCWLRGHARVAARVVAMRPTAGFLGPELNCPGSRVHVVTPRRAALA
eukprot:10640344-Lingulodinium_polyedra.AAC.1